MSDSVVQQRATGDEYRAIFETASEAITIIDYDCIIVEANPAACRLYGYAYEELVGLHSTAVTHPEDHDLASYVPDTLKGGGSITQRARNVRKDGTVFHIEECATGLMYGGQPHILSVVRDITTQVEAEEALRASEATNRALLAALPDMMFRLSKDGIYLDVKAERHGDPALPPQSIIGRHIGEVLPAHVAEEALRCVERTLLTGQMQILEYSLQSEGTARHFEARNVVSGPDEVLAIVRDVTDRVRAYELLEQRVEEHTRELSTLLEVSQNVASTLDLQPLLRLILAQIKPVVDFVEANITILEGDRLTFLSYWGPREAETVVGLSFSLARAAANRQVIEGREPLIIADIWDDSPLAVSFRQVGAEDLDNSHLPFTAWMGVPLVYKDRVTGMLGLSHPQRGYYTPQHARLALAIANQAAVAIENARLYARAQEAAALEERQRLARELHDSVSQALYGIGLGARTARMLLDRDPERAAEPLDYVLELAEAGLAEMRALIFELLPQALEREGLVAALQRQIAAVRARHRIAVAADLGSEPAAPLQVKEGLYRIAQEALHNVVKHAEARRVEIRLDNAATGLILEVRDDGVGFDTGDAFPGHLGLHTMRERARRVGGTLEVMSAPGAGTRVRVEIGEPATF